MADFFRRAWETASEESRKKISDALLEKVLEAVKTAKPWDMYSMVGRIIDTAVTAEVRALIATDAARVVEEHRDEIKKTYETVAKKVTSAACLAVANQATERAARAAVAAVTASVEAALKK